MTKKTSIAINCSNKICMHIAVVGKNKRSETINHQVYVWMQNKVYI